MKTTSTIIAMIATFIVSGASAANAQTTTADNRAFLSVSVGGQFTSHDFTGIATFPLYDETGTVTANQTVGSGFVFDATGGYRFAGSFAGAVGVSTFNGSGGAASVASIPNPLFF